MKISLSSIKSIGAGKFAGKHMGFILWPIIIIFLAVEIFIVKKSVDSLTAIYNRVPAFQSRIVRVDLTRNSLIEKRLQENASFSAKEPRAQDPFGTGKDTPSQ